MSTHRAKADSRHTAGFDSPRLLRRALRVHLIATSSVLLAVLGAMLLTEWLLTTRQADRIAAVVTTRLAESVLQPLSAMDFADEGFDTAALDAELRGFFASGTIERIKVWRVEGDEVRVVYSDLDEIVGEVRPFSAELATRLDAGETVVLPVPNDVEHRFEAGLPVELREAFIGFTDTAGRDMRLEVYVPVYTRQMIAGALSLQAPVIAGGLVALLVVLLPLSIRLVRRLERLDAEHERVLAFGQRAREQERADLARRLHDDVVQSLSGARLAVGSLERTAGTRESDVLDRVGDVLAESMASLRGMLTEFVPGAVTAASLEHDVAELAARVRAGRNGAPPTLLYTGPGEEDRAVLARLDDDAAAVLFHAAQEGLRNAVEHADARVIALRLTADREADGAQTVRITVEDDGAGIDAGAARRARAEGHVGLELVRRAVEAIGGGMTVRARHPENTGGTGTVLTCFVRARR